MRDIPLSRLPFPCSASFGKLFGFVLLASALTIACDQQSPFSTADKTPGIPVKVEILSSATVEDSSEFVGILEAAQKATLKAQSQGRVQQISVKPGDRVAQGSVILSLQPDKTTLTSLQAQINQAKANRESAIQQLKVDRAKRAIAQSNYQLEQTNFDRVKYVAEQGGYNQYDLNNRKLQLETAKNDLQGVEEQIKLSQARVSQAEADMRRLEAEAALAKGDGQAKPVAAPIAGVIGDLAVKVGDAVIPGEAIASITQNDRLDLQILVPGNRASRLRQGIPVIVIDPTTKKTLAKGQINFVAPHVDSKTQTILAKARLKNSNNTLRDGQSVLVRVLWNQKPGVLVPTTAVSQTDGKSFVFVAETSAEQGKRAKQVVRQRPVELGSLQGSNYQVISGLKPGDRIATTNIQELRDGAPIKPES
jgi:RND family efflux transporter MFP subunit